MGKLQFCAGLSGRRGFLRNCVLLGAGTLLFGGTPQAAGKAPASAAVDSGGFVVINGWVLPSRYLRDDQS